MDKINDGYIENAVELLNDIYKKYSNRYQFENTAYSKKAYSKNKTDVTDQFLTTFLRMSRYTVPKLYTGRDFKGEDHTEYFFDDNVLTAQKVFANGSICDSFYIRTDDQKIRLSFSFNSLLNIHCCSFSGEKLFRIDNAHFDNYGELQYISGEQYEYSSGRLVRCTGYDRYAPQFPMFKEYVHDEMTVTVNPTLYEYSFIYDNDGKLAQYALSYSDKLFNVSPKAAKYFEKVNMNTDIEQIVLW